MQQKTNSFEKCIWILLVALSIGAAIAKLFVGFDIDEGYAISMPQRLLQGDHLFLEMWEVHQTSSFLPVFFMGIYEAMTQSVDGIVLYVRVIATIMHLAMSFFVWKNLSWMETKWRWLLVLLYFNMLPKWMMSLDFSMQQIWGVTCVLIFLYQTQNTQQKKMAYFMGVFLAMTVLAYPGMVVLYPVLLGILLWTGEQKKQLGSINKWKLCIWFTMGCFTMAVIFFVYVLSSTTLSKFLQAIPLIFMDGTHQFTMATKLMAYGRQWMNVAKQILIFSIPSAIIAWIGRKIWEKKKGVDCKPVEKAFGVWFAMSFSVITSLLVILANVVGIEMGPFHFQVRYLGWYLIGLILAFLKRKEKPVLFADVFLISLAAFLGILVFSNVGPDSSSSYLVLGLMGSFYLIHKIIEHEKSLDKLLWMVGALFVVSLLFCKGYYVRITEYGPSNIWNERMQVKEGPLKGIWLLPKDYETAIADYETIRTVTDEDTKLLYLGTEGISNLYTTGQYVSPSTISTPAFNEQWTLYFTRMPEKEPDIIVLAKNTIDDREKFFAKNPFGIWICEKYDTMHREETNSLCIIRKK